ncbi:PorP/SprF family type IX secretion system membrane protein [Robiginitalea sp. SC105]|nr:PorP/SprF family type IX secretion system membrane protein [Robiginitalea sp. SC105]
MFVLLLCTTGPLLRAQEENPILAYEVPSQNLLKYNRFLINPTFSTVREDKSYINLLHRNQSVSFDDNNQMYFLSYSGRIGDRSGLGLSLYTQREGTLSNYGVLANYAYGVKLSDKSNFTFGANLSYYSSGFDESIANPVEQDPFLSGFQNSSLLTFQPGFNISYGPFDFGVYAENLIDYNLKASDFITEFKDKTFSGHLQYTHQFPATSGIFEEGRLMPLARVRKVGEDETVLGGNLILDLPKLGWLQGGYDSFYGASAGIGFNINRRLSIGYTMEKGLSNSFDNLGLTHEISFAYSFTPNLTEDRVMLENEMEDSLAEAGEEPIEVTDKDTEIAELKRRLAENDAILAELMFRQDSLENSRQRELEQRFEMVMRMVRQETGGDRADLEEKARQVYFVNNDQTRLAANDSTNIPSGISPENRTDKTQLAGIDRNLEDRQTKTDRDAAANLQEEARKLPARANDRTAVAAADVKETRDGERTAAQTGETQVRSRKFRDLQGVQDGYYVVANVYKGTTYMDKFMDRLNQDGFQADYIDNKNNGLKYVYLTRFDNWEDAARAVRSGVDGAYQGDLWVMNVANRYSNEAYADNTRRIEEKSEQYQADVLQKNVVAQDKVAAAEADDRFVAGQGGTSYYLIANVFANPKNANRFVKYLNSLGLSASYFINPANKYRYVYVKRHQNWNSALISYYSKLNNMYDDKMWIMRVTPNLIA